MDRPPLGRHELGGGLLVFGGDFALGDLDAGRQGLGGQRQQADGSRFHGPEPRLVFLEELGQFLFGRLLARFEQHGAQRDIFDGALVVVIGAGDIERHLGNVGTVEDHPHLLAARGAALKVEIFGLGKAGLAQHGGKFVGIEQPHGTGE